MPISIVEIRNVLGTEASLGWAGSHTVVIDRPDGRAGGMGLGFNGAQLLGLAVGGCLANDLRYIAAEAETAIGEISITVEVRLEGDPIIATGIVMRVAATIVGGDDPMALIEQAKLRSMAMNSVARGIPVTVSV